MNFRKLINLTCTSALTVLFLLAVIFVSSCQKESDVTPATTDASAAFTSQASSESLTKLAATATFLGKPISSSAPMALYKKSNVTISGLTISGGSSPCIQLTNCTNIHITKCKITNSTNYGILIGSGCSNILIDSCLITNVGTGVFAVTCPGGQIRVQNNQFQNMKGPFPKGDFVQFSGVGGHYNRIVNNYGENIAGQSTPEDGISIYNSNGVAGDPILVTGNYIRGGGPSTTGSGITVGDQGGSYITVSNNKVVTSGNIGMQIAGGNNIIMTNNSVYSYATSISHLGVGYGNYSGKSMYNNTVSYNKINWLSGKAADLAYYKNVKSIQKDISCQAGLAQPAGYTSNTLKAPISGSIVPTTMITWK